MILLNHILRNGYSFGGIHWIKLADLFKKSERVCVDKIFGHAIPTFVVRKFLGR